MAEVRRYLELVDVLVERNLRVRYRGSVLGVYWSLLNPLIMTGVYAAIFGAVFATYYNDSMVDYVLAAFVGLIVINFFSASTSQALVSVVGNGALLNKMQLPFSIFPVSIIAANTFQFCVGSLPLLLGVTLLKSGSLVNSLIVCLPVVALIITSMGIGFLISALFVFFRDLPYFYELVTFALWITSPVFYPSEIVPEKVQVFLSFNPIATIIKSIRQVALSGDIPDFSLIASAWLTSVMLLVFGWICFRWWRPNFMDLL